MSNSLTAFLVAIGSSAWIFNKVYKRTGGNTGRSLGTAIMSGVVIF